jgi:hypothetical protein
MNVILLTAEHDPTAPGWGKFLAMVAAIGGVWLIFAVKDRIKRVKAGDEIDPFSPEGSEDTEEEFSQVDTPTDQVGKGSQKGGRKWFRKA